MAAISFPESLNTQEADSPVQPVLDAVSEALARPRLGTVQLVVHEGRVVQRDVTDRMRFH